MRFFLPATAAAFLFMLGCDSKECTSQSDCPGGNICTGDGTCVPSCATPPCRVTQDAGPRDTGVDTGVDGGDTGVDGGDAGVDGGDTGVDGGDAGVDGGDAGDAGPDAGGLPNAGVVWLGEFLTTPASFTAYAEFKDRSAGMYDVSTQAFTPADGVCALSSVRRTGGMEVGIEAGSVMIVTGQLANQMIAYGPVGGGRYEPTAPLTANIYFNSPGVDFDIAGGSGTGVPPTTASLPAPPQLIVLLPMANQTVLLQQGVTFSWQAGGAGGSAVTVAELYDVDRRVSLSCVVADDGSFTLPSDAVQAFQDLSPAAPYTLELRYQVTTVQTVTLQGTNVELPIELIAARGQRWAAQ